MSQVEGTPGRLDLARLNAFVDPAAETFAKHKLDFVLSPQLLQARFTLPNLTWQAIRFGDEAALSDVPDDRRGVYAFVLQQESRVLPPHAYVLYIGLAGRSPKRSLRDRYREYLRASQLIRRARIARMIATWHDVLSFHFAPVEEDVTTEQLLRLERQLNSALVPPFSEQDLDAEIKRQRRAFQ